MDSTRLHSIMDNIYIPKGSKPSGNDIPSHHPSLIMQDSMTDTTHHLQCGCNGGACIEEKAWWYKNNSNGNSNSNNHYHFNNKKNSISISSTSSASNSKVPRPVVMSTASSSSVSSSSTTSLSLDSSESSVSDYEGY